MVVEYTVSGRDAHFLKLELGCGNAERDNRTYTCSVGCSLEDGTKYFLVVSGTGDTQGANVYEQRTTGSDAETNVPSNAG